MITTTTTTTTGANALAAIDLQKLARLDLRRIAFHEAGHAVLTSRYSFSLDVYLWPDDSGDALNFKTVRGQARLAFYFPPTKTIKSACGWAGVVAESIEFEGAVPAEELGWKWEECLDGPYHCHELSETDRVAIDADRADGHDSPRFRAFATAYRRLVKAWPTVRAIAEQLQSEYLAKGHAVVYWGRGGWWWGSGSRVGDLPLPKPWPLAEVKTVDLEGILSAQRAASHDSRELASRVGSGPSSATNSAASRNS